MDMLRTFSARLRQLHTMLMFHELSPCFLINPGKPMTLIKFLVFIIACGAIELDLFVAYFFAYLLQHYTILTLPR